MNRGVVTIAVLVALSFASASQAITIIKSFPSPTNNAGDAAWDGSSLWLSDGLSSELVQINPSSGAVLSNPFAPGDNPRGLASDGTHLYNANLVVPGDDYLYTLSPPSMVVNSWMVPDSPNASPGGVAYDPVSGHLWLSDSAADKVYELDLDGNVISSFVYPGTNARGITWYGGHIFAVDDADLMLYKLDTSGSIVGSASIAELGTDPQGLAFDGQYFWITENSTEKIYQIGADFGGSQLPVPLLSDGGMTLLILGLCGVSFHFLGSNRREGQKDRSLTRRIPRS